MANRRTAPVPQAGAASHDIGGAIVRRRFIMGGKELQAGQVLTAGEVESISRNNYNSLRDNGFLQVFPRAVRTHLEAEEHGPVEYHAALKGFGAFDVIEGKKINSQPLTKAQAYDLIRQKQLDRAVPAEVPTSVPEELNSAVEHSPTV